MSNPMRPLRVKKKQLYSFSKSIYGEAGPDCGSGLETQEVQEVVELHVRESSGCADIKMQT